MIAHVVLVAMRSGMAIGKNGKTAGKCTERSQACAGSAAAAAAERSLSPFLVEVSAMLRKVADLAVPQFFLMRRCAWRNSFQSMDPEPSRSAMRNSPRSWSALYLGSGQRVGHG